MVCVTSALILMTGAPVKLTGNPFRYVTRSGNDLAFADGKIRATGFDTRGKAKVGTHNRSFDLVVGDFVSVEAEGHYTVAT